MIVLIARGAQLTRRPADAALSSLRSYGSGVWLLAGRLLKLHATLRCGLCRDWIPGVKPVATGCGLRLVLFDDLLDQVHEGGDADEDADEVVDVLEGDGGAGADPGGAEAAGCFEESAHGWGGWWEWNLAPRPWSGLGRRPWLWGCWGLRGREVGRYGSPPLLGLVAS